MVKETEIINPEWMCAGECGRMDLTPEDSSSQEPTYCQACYDKMVADGRL